MDRGKLQKTFAALYQHTRAADYQVWLHQRPKDFKRHPLKEQGQGYITSSAIEALLADESGKQRQRKKRYIYCEGEHWSDECLRYPNIEVRKNKLKNRCFICLKKIIKQSIVKYRRSHACTAERIENIIGVYAQRSFEWRAQWKNRKERINQQQVQEAVWLLWGKK